MEDKYLYMIRKAQEFMNENHFADVSRVQCLLRKMMSKEYHGLIDQIKECQDPHVIFNIHGGNNLIAPNASQAASIDWNAVIILAALFCVTYLYYLGFIKFYRRYTLENLMSILVDEQLNGAIENQANNDNNNENVANGNEG